MLCGGSQVVRSGVICKFDTHLPSTVCCAGKQIATVVPSVE